MHIEDCASAEQDVPHLHGGKAERTESSGGGWDCDPCTLHNAYENRYCGACENPRPKQANKTKAKNKQKKQRKQAVDSDDDDFLPDV